MNLIKLSSWIIGVCILLLSTRLDSFADSPENTPLKLFYIEDDNNVFNVKSIEKLHSLNKLHVAPSINLKYDASTIWIRVEKPLKDSSEQLLVIENAHLDLIEIYFYSEKKIISKRISGDERQFNLRDINSNYFNFAIPEKATTIYMKVKTEGPMIVPIKILEYKTYFAYIQKYSIVHYIYFGFIILALISNILLYFWLREAINIYYCLFLIGVGLITAVDFEYTFQYLWPNTPSINKYNSYIYLLSITTLLFTEKLFNLKEQSPFIHRVYQAFYILIGCTAILFFFISYRLAIEIVFYVLFFTPIICLLTGLYFYFKINISFLRFFLIGWIIFLVSTFIYTIAIANWIPSNFYTYNAIQIGSAIEIIFFNLAVISRLNILKEEKEALLAIKNKSLEDINKELLDKNQRLERYASVTNHNLRGPVATLLGLTNTFNTNDLNDVNNKFVIEKTKETGKQIDSIVKDLNSLLYSGKRSEEVFETVNLAMTLNKVRQLLKDKIKQSEIIIDQDFSEVPFVYGIPDYVESIFYHLIENAIKYKKERTEAKLFIKSGKDREGICIQFTDNGIGIDLEKFRYAIFQPYKKFHKNAPGRGIGLYTVKAQLESMDGKITVESKVGEGTTFTLTFRKPIGK